MASGVSNVLEYLGVGHPKVIRDTGGKGSTMVVKFLSKGSTGLANPESPTPNGPSSPLKWRNQPGASQATDQRR
ncbi:hypothetical protein J6590_030831 [Homalodisca vitripennis]|nr:hypothetical protein J6590_030831 [Homalodisca vitripennis]